MSKLWNISVAIRDVEGLALYQFIYDEWREAYMASEHEDFMAFQHYVQRKYPDVYRKALAYWRLMGWV